MLDDLWPTLPNPAQSVYLQLYRLSYGNGRSTCKVSIPKLAERSGLKLTATRAAVRYLESHGLVERLRIDLDARVQTERGVEYRVNLPKTTPPGAVAAFPDEAPSPNEPASQAEETT